MNLNSSHLARVSGTIIGLGVAGAVALRCSNSAGDWLGRKVYRLTGYSLMNITPRFISNAYQHLGLPLAYVIDAVEADFPLLGRCVVAPVLEELVFRGSLLAMQHYFNLQGRIASIMVSSHALSCAHGSAQPGRACSLFLVGIVTGLLVDRFGEIGLAAAVLAHSLHNYSLDLI